MSTSFAAQPLPLTTDADGVIRVSSTRVALDTVVHAFADGATAEEIAQQYPSVSLADIYQVIGHYLQCPLDVEAYLQQRRGQRQAVRSGNEARFDPRGIRDRLLARRTSRTR